MTSNIILSEVVDSLVELSDKDVQERLWLYGGTKEMSSFEEAICGIFDDGGVTKALDRGELDPLISILFVRLNALIDKIPTNISPQEQIDHPAMLDIRKVSLELLHLLRQQCG